MNPPREETFEERLRQHSEETPHDLSDELIAAHRSVLSSDPIETKVESETATASSVLPCLEILERARQRQIHNAIGSSEAPRGQGRLGRFEMQRFLGEGSFGVVYLARDGLLDRDVALKIARPEVSMSPSMRSRFRHEAEMSAQLDHPGIVPVYESGEEDGVQYIASAFCDGPTLQDWIDSQEPDARLPCKDIASFVRTLAEAMGHAHRKGVLHRDLKPSNVLLTQSNAQPHTSSSFAMLDDVKARIADFGLGQLAESVELTRTGAILGTPAYMAPEQATGNRKQICTASDVYAIGVILYRLLTMRLPFEQTETLQLLQAVKSTQPPAPIRWRQEIPIDLNSICLKCLEKSPSQRYANGHDLADDLSAFLNHRPVVARPLSLVGQTVRWFQRSPLIASVCIFTAAMVTFTAVGATVAATLLATQRAQTQRNLDRALEAESELQETIRTLEDKLYATAQQPRIDALTRVINNQPQSFASLYDRGTEYWRLEQYDLALKDFDRVLELNPAHANALADKAWILLVGGPQYRDDAAAYRLTQQIVYPPQNNWSILATRALASYRVGHYNEARELIEKTIIVRQQTGYEPNSFHLYTLAMVQWALGQKDEARNAFERAEQQLAQTSYELPRAEVNRLRSEAVRQQENTHDEL